MRTKIWEIRIINNFRNNKKELTNDFARKYAFFIVIIENI